MVEYDLSYSGISDGEMMSDLADETGPVGQTVWKDEVRHHLCEEILPFWMRKVCDPEGGFYGAVDCGGHVQRDADRSLVVNARILWTFSAAVRVLGTDYQAYADKAFVYLRDHFLDPEHGGAYWMVNAAGKPVNTRKQIYGQAFAIYAFAEYARAFHSVEALDIARALFVAVETYGSDPVHGGYFEARDECWQPLADQRLSDKDMNVPKSMNTHLHIMEAYTNLLRVWPDPVLVRAQTSVLRLMMDRIVDPLSGHFRLFFDADWHCCSDHVSFGHDIEGSWLLPEAAEVLGNQGLSVRARALSLLMAEEAWGEGRDIDGSLFYEADSVGQLIDANKHWWPQAEGVIGFLNAWQQSGDEKYRTAARTVWDYIMAKLVVPSEGEWRAKLRRDGTPLSHAEDPDVCLAGPWKGPYHNARCCFELIERL